MCGRAICLRVIHNILKQRTNYRLYLIFYKQLQKGHWNRICDCPLFLWFYLQQYFGQFILGVWKIMPFLWLSLILSQILDILRYVEDWFYCRRFLFTKRFQFVHINLVNGFLFVFNHITFVNTLPSFHSWWFTL